MPTSFTPLVSEALPAGEPSSADKTAADAAVFKPATPEALPQLRPTRSSAVGGACPDGLPRLALEREGDRVTRIRITCTCGQMIELDCVY